MAGGWDGDKSQEAARSWRAKLTFAISQFTLIGSSAGSEQPYLLGALPKPAWLASTDFTAFSTLNAEPFYRASGFRTIGLIDVSNGMEPSLSRLSSWECIYSL